MLLERAMVAVDAGAAAVLHQPVGSDALQVVHAIGFESDELRALASAAPADHGAAPRVATRDSLRPGSALASASAAQPLLSAPLLVDGARGWLVLALLPGREIAEPDRVFCQVLARQCEQALQRSFLFQAEADARRLAERATRSRDEMLAVVSHDLRNPLSTIQMSAEQLDPAPGVPAPDAERTRRLAQRIRRSADRMDHLIRGLLDLASLDAGQFSVNREPTDLCALLRDAQAAMVPQGQASGIALALDCDEPLPEVVCDRRRIQQVLANLVGNAFKFTPAGGTVTVVATARTGHIAVSVRDDGAGIAPAHLSRVFDRFWQLEKAGRGVGLGLSIVRALVEAHGGRVGVDSVPGAGSTFWFTLPCGLAAAS
ncbi:MAG: HAMP domain-containing sensor histidine kinase [Polyangiaceae bacterium]